MSNPSTTYERAFLEPLRSQGMFVRIVGQDWQPGTLIIDCNVYLTDTDESGGPTNPFCITSQEPKRAADGRCVCCDQIGHGPEYQRGSVKCPLCNATTMPWSITERSFRGLFQIIPGKPAAMQPPPSYDLPHGMKWMTNDEQIAAISHALRYAAEWCFSSEQAESFGWPTIQERLRAEEAASEAVALEEARDLSSWLETAYDEMPALISLNNDTDDDMPPLIPLMPVMPLH